MDYQMPVLNGIEATKKIRELQIAKLMPYVQIIGCTAFGGTSQIEACLLSGMAQVVLKPINFEVVKNILEDYL